MAMSVLEEVIWCAGGLEVLSCLVFEGPLTISEVSARVGSDEESVLFPIWFLEPLGMVGRIDDPGGGDPLYTAKLDDQPEALQNVVERHRRESEDQP